MPLISICIPTFNRALCLDTCIKSIISQFTDLDVKENIEIVVSDNASEDTTKVLMETYTSKYPEHIRYHRHAQNIGFDRNLLHVVDMAAGEYCLTFGDDDAFIEGCFNELIQKIKKYRSPYFMLNCWGYDNALQHQIHNKPNRHLSSDTHFPTLSDFVKTLDTYIDIVGNFGGMSVQLFSKSYWIHSVNKEQYIGSQTIHLFVLLSAFKDAPFTLLFSPMVKTRNDNMRWDTYPGLETHKKRALMTINTAMWISNLYDLKLDRKKVHSALIRRAYIISCKEQIKKILYILHLRR